MIEVKLPIIFNGHTVNRAGLLSKQNGNAGSDVYIARKILDGEDYEIPNRRYDNIPDYLPTGKYFALSWCDYFKEDYEVLIPLLLKYGFTNTFKNQIIPTSNDYLTPGQYPQYTPQNFNKQKQALCYNGNHGYLHFAFIHQLPIADGLTTPTNNEMRMDRGDGTNEFNLPINETVADSLDTVYCDAWFKIGSTIYNKQWQNLTDADCVVMRQYMGAFTIPLDPQNGQQVLESMDFLSERYCGTTGKSVYNDDYTATRTPNTVDGNPISENNPIVGGIFQGAETTQNHEIWERIEQIIIDYKDEVHNIGNTLTYWSTCGGVSRELLYHPQGAETKRRYYDIAHTKIASGVTKFDSTILGTSRSLIDILRDKGYKSMMGAVYSGYREGWYSDSTDRREGQRIYKKNATLGKPDNLADGYFHAFRIFDNTIPEVDQETLLASDNVLQALYDFTATDAAYSGGSWLTARFCSVVNQIVRMTAWNMIPEGFGDSGSNTDVKDASFALVLECLMQFLRAANIRMIAQEDAQDIVYNKTFAKGLNIFPNPTFKNTLKEILPNSVNIPDYPDGWDGGVVTDGIYHIDNTGGGSPVTYITRCYSIQHGELNLSINALGKGVLKIKTIKNIDQYHQTSGVGFTNLITKNIDVSEWTEIAGSGIISDAALVEYGAPADADELIDQLYWNGYDNKICGLHIAIEVQAGDEIKLSTGSIIIKETDYDETYGAEAETYFDKMITEPDVTQKGKINTFFEALKSAGLWEKIDVGLLLGGHTNNDSEALINIVNPGTFDATLHGTVNPAFTAFEGFTGDIANEAYISMNWNPSDNGINYQKDSASAGVYIRTNINESGYDMGVYDAIGNLSIRTRRIDRIYGEINDVIVSSYANADSRGMTYVSRIQSAYKFIKKNKDAAYNTGANTTAMPSTGLNVALLARQRSGIIDNFSSKQIAFAFIGSGMTETHMEDMTDAIEAYMDSNGKGVIT